MMQSDSNPSFFQKLIGLPPFLYQFAKWKLGFCRRLRTHDPILVFQMGKVGSRSISEPLNRVYRGAVVHAHVLSADYPQGEVKELVRYLESDAPPRHMFILSPIRDPFDRNISAFFQNFERHTGQTPEACTLSIADLQQRFINSFPHQVPINWLKGSIVDRFHIDIYATPFPDRGWQTYQSEGVSLLILRCEIEDAEKENAVNSFLDRDDYRVGDVNVTARKGYGELYSEFKRTLILPASIVETICDSAYFNHFYPAEQVEAARLRWSGKNR